jgi:hypothetical protein
MPGALELNQQQKLLRAAPTKKKAKKNNIRDDFLQALQTAQPILIPVIYTNRVINENDKTLLLNYAMENNLIVTLHTLGLGKTCWSFSQARS